MNHIASIIIPNLNGKRFLKDCLYSLKHQTYKDFEIILVDNGSSDDSVDFVKKNFPEVLVISNENNLGFAEANNQGLAISKGEYIITLNNDTKIDEKWLENLVKTVQQDENIGMCASKILSTNDTKKIDSIGVSICVDGMSRGRKRMEIDDGQYNKSKEILLPSACAALYRRKMLDEIGFFDRDFFAYCEDTDLGLRGRLAGWKAILVPDAIVYHYYSSTGGNYSSFKAYLIERNHMWVVIKNFPIEFLICFPFFTFYRMLLQSFSGLFEKGATSEFLKQYSLGKALKITARAYWDAIKKISVFWRKRNIIMKNKKIGRIEFYRLLKNNRLSFKELVFKK